MQGPEDTSLDTSPGARSEPATQDLAPGTRIGRFTILERIGEGGMGTVAAAYDPELDRRVAIKVLPQDAEDPRTQARLLREARAMARLSDPHVVTVYEADVHEGRVFVAMELVQGSTLRAWLAEGPRGWRDVLAVFREAGAGLAAAHAVDLVHRDFKPENVLIGLGPRGARAFGRVRVADFGLARAPPSARRDSGAPSGEPDPIHDARSGSDGDLERDLAKPASAEARSSDGGARVTRAGVAPGTPAYMAPEQFLGDPLDARTDQFAFCVALWEALYGTRPFSGRTRFELADAIVNGRIDPPPTGADVPPWLRSVVERGLAVAPADRHPSMLALLQALDRDPHRRLVTRATGAVLLLVLGVSVGLTVHAMATTRACSDTERKLDGIWDDPQRTAIANAFVASGAARASAHAERTIAALDDFTERWITGHRDACEAASVRREQSMDVLDRRTRCLDRRRRALAELVLVLGKADAVAVEHAANAAHGLPAPESCSDLEFVSATIEPPEDPRTAEQVAAIRDELARIDAERRTGHVQRALARACSLATEVHHPDYAPLRAEAGLACGIARGDAGEWAGAEASLRASYFDALALGADDVATEAARCLAALTGYLLHRHDEGMEWVAHARAVAARPGVDPTRALAITFDVASIHLAAGRLLEAERELDPAIDRLRARGDEGLALADALNMYGGVQLARGRLDAALLAFEEALAIYEHTLGEHTQPVARVLDNLGSVAWQNSDYTRAEELQTRALEIRETAFGPDHPEVLASLQNLAGTALARGDEAHAHALLERVIAIYERRNDDPPQLANALHNLAVVRRGLGHPEAVDTARRALAAREQTLGHDHIEVGRSHANLAWLLNTRGDTAEAAHHFARAVAIREASGAALADVASARYGLALAQWATPALREEALRVATLALDEATRAGEAEQALTQEIAEWLNEHRR